MSDGLTTAGEVGDDAAAPDPVLTGPLFWVVLRQGLPLALGMLSHALFNIVDLVLVGRLGEKAVAGVHVATTINFLPMIVGNGVSVATMSIMARRMGRGEVGAAAALSSRSQLIMIVLGVLIGVIGALIAVPCIDLQGVTGQARTWGIHYLVVAQLGTVTMFIVMQTTATMRVLGESFMPLLILIGANVLNILLDIVLLFGWDDLGIPAFGAPGAAYASVIARVLGAAAGLWWIRRVGYRLRFELPAVRADRRELREIVRLGLPQSMQMLVRALVVIACTRIAGELGGQDAIAALGVTMRLDTMVLFSSIGFASAATAIVGRSFGARKLRRAKAACRVAGLCAAAMGAMIVVCFVIDAEFWIRLFIEDPGGGVVEAGRRYLNVAALSLPLASFCVAVAGGVNGAGRVIAPMALDMVGYLGFLLPVLVLVAVFSPTGELSNVWYAYLAANALIAVGYAVYLERGRWLRRIGRLPV